MYLHPWGMTTKLHWHPSAPTALPPPKSAVKSSHGYNSGVIVGPDICNERLLGLVPH